MNRIRQLSIYFFIPGVLDTYAILFKPSTRFRTGQVRIHGRKYFVGGDVFTAERVNENETPRVKV